MPTALSLAGLKTPETCQGENIRPVLEANEPTVGENVAYIEAFRHEAIGVRSLDHLYGIPMRGPSEAEWQPDPAMNEHLFFDMREDPFQQHNLIGTGEQSDTAEALRAQLLAWHTRTPRRPIPPPTRGMKQINIY